MSLIGLAFSKKNKIYELKQLIDLGFDSVRAVVSKLLKGANKYFFRVLGNFNVLYNNLRDYKQKNRNPKPYIYHTLKLSKSLSYTHLGHLFYQLGPDNYRDLGVENDIMLFFFQLL